MITHITHNQRISAVYTVLQELTLTYFDTWFSPCLLIKVAIAVTMNVLIVAVQVLTLRAHLIITWSTGSANGYKTSKSTWRLCIISVTGTVSSKTSQVLTQIIIDKRHIYFSLLPLLGKQLQLSPKSGVKKANFSTIINL